MDRPAASAPAASGGTASTRASSPLRTPDPHRAADQPAAVQMLITSNPAVGSPRMMLSWSWMSAWPRMTRRAQAEGKALGAPVGEFGHFQHVEHGLDKRLI